MAIYDKDPIVSFKSELLKKIKDNGLEINEESSFEVISQSLPILNRRKESKLDILLQNDQTRELYNKLKDLPFSEVRKIYLSKDSLIDDKKQDEKAESKKGSKRDNLIKHLFNIQHIIHLYKEKRYNEFIRKTEFKITSIERKREIKALIEQIEGMSKSTIEEVIDFANESGLCIKDDRFNAFVRKNEYLYGRVKSVSFGEFQNLYNYLEGFTPFSTQHKVKGTEFKNVFVILDNGQWNNYNFEYLFTNRTDKAKVFVRSQKIFYVCCTRAMDNLTVFFYEPSAAVIEKALEWFGEENVHPIG